ncbi:hypothetical protein Fmac_023362 [Flemingia macrophylla]|uniref:MADS-box domain-containing protein n=1 Tax=Flemingia macrophylla TaxID=520843 RepID=A0ABD1LLA2_9FABA
MSNSNANANANAKRSRGRQKIEMKKMSNESNLQVTFSKRRSGLFKKASELCTLCGVDVALVVFSPGEKVFSFGHPNVDAVIDRYLTQGPPPNSDTMQFIEAHRIANVRELNAQLTHINMQLDAERKRNEELLSLKKAAQAQQWWALPIEELGRAHLEQYKVALEELKKQVDRAMLQSVVNLNPPPHQFFPGASSSYSPNHPVHQPHVFPPQPPLPPNYVYVDGNMMRQHGFNNMGFGGYGPSAGGGVELEELEGGGDEGISGDVGSGKRQLKKTVEVSKEKLKPVVVMTPLYLLRSAQTTRKKEISKNSKKHFCRRNSPIQISKPNSNILLCRQGAEVGVVTPTR